MIKLKIALYTRSFPPKSGGVSTAHYNLYNLLKNDYEVKVFAFDEDENKSSNSIFKRKTIARLNTFILLLIRWKFKKKKKEIKFNNVKRVISVFIPVLRLNKPLKVFQPDIIIVPDNFVPAYFLNKPKGSKLVCFAHHNYSRFMNQPLLEDQDWLDLQIAYSMEIKAMKKVDSVISPSEYMIESYKHTTYKNKPLFKINNFLESKIFESITRQQEQNTDFPQSKRVIYIPSAGSTIKGRRYVFELVRRLLNLDLDIHFYLSGNLPSDLQFELKSYADRIYAPGHVKWEQNVKNVTKCYMGITPNIEENFSYAILEAQAAGLPFVAFDTGGNKEIIMDEVTGFIVPYLDIESLINKSALLLNDSKLQTSFKEKASKYAEKRFNSGLILNRYHSVLKKIMEL